MEKIRNPFGRLAIHVVLIVFAIYSAFPFVWTTLQSFKSFRDANSRTPLFWDLNPHGKIIRRSGYALFPNQAGRPLHSSCYWQWCCSFVRCSLPATYLSRMG